MLNIRLKMLQNVCPETFGFEIHVNVIWCDSSKVRSVITQR
jgi:hypothetical protein